MNLPQQSKEYPGTFTFDRVFNSDSKQKDVFDYSISTIVDGMLPCGACLCILAVKLFVLTRLCAR